MQAAFVDIGAERTGFLHVDDLYIDKSDSGGDRDTGTPDIKTLLHEGQKNTGPGHQRSYQYQRCAPYCPAVSCGAVPGIYG